MTTAQQAVVPPAPDDEDRELIAALTALYFIGLSLRTGGYAGTVEEQHARAKELAASSLQ